MTRFLQDLLRYVHAHTYKFFFKITFYLNMNSWVVEQVNGNYINALQMCIAEKSYIFFMHAN